MCGPPAQGSRVRCLRRRRPRRARFGRRQKTRSGIHDPIARTLPLRGAGRHDWWCQFDRSPILTASGEPNRSGGVEPLTLLRRPPLPSSRSTAHRVRRQQASLSRGDSRRTAITATAAAESTAATPPAILRRTTRARATARHSSRTARLTRSSRSGGTSARIPARRSRRAIASSCSASGTGLRPLTSMPSVTVPPLETRHAPDGTGQVPGNHGKRVAERFSCT